MMQKHFAIWGMTREGMTLQGQVAKAAYVADGIIMLVTSGAVDRGDMPPGFHRFLTEEEMEAEGLNKSISQPDQLFFLGSDPEAFKSCYSAQDAKSLANSNIRVIGTISEG